MAENNEQQATSVNLARVEDRARRLYNEARSFSDDPALSDLARRNAKSAQSVAALAVLLGQSGRAAEAAHGLAVAERIRADVIAQGLLPAAEEGKAFNEGRRMPKPSPLTRLVDDALGALGRRASAKDVFRRIQATPDEKVIQEIDDSDSDAPVIYWRARNGREMTTAFKRFQDLVSERRKKI